MGATPQAMQDQLPRLDEAQERAVALRAELASINAEHRTWLRAQGQDVAERRARPRKMPVHGQQ